MGSFARKITTMAKKKIFQLVSNHPKHPSNYTLAAWQQFLCVYIFFILIKIKTDYEEQDDEKEEEMLLGQ